MSIFSLRILLLFFQTIDSDLYICKLHQDRYPFVQNKVMAHLKTLFSSKLIFMSQPILLLQHVNQSNRSKEEKTAYIEYFILKYLSLKKSQQQHFNQCICFPPPTTTADTLFAILEYLGMYYQSGATHAEEQKNNAEYFIIHRQEHYQPKS